MPADPRNQTSTLLLGITTLFAAFLASQDSVMAESGSSNTKPKILLLEDCDDDYKTPPFEDAVVIFDSNAKPIRKVSNLNICETIGGSHALAASKDGEFFVLCEIVAKRLRAFRTETGEPLWSLDGDFIAAVVAPDDEVYALSGRTIEGAEIKVIDRNGKIVRQAAIGGFDLVLDPERKAIWVVGGKITKCDLNLHSLVDLDPIPWCAVSVDVNPDGSVWIAEREHFQVARSTNRLLKISFDGRIVKSIYLDWSPVCVRVNHSDGSVWVTGSEGRKSFLGRLLESLEKRTGPLPMWKKARDFLKRKHVSTATHKYDASGTLLRTIGLGGHHMDIDQGDGSVWIATDDNLRHYSATGLKLDQIRGASNSQKYVAIIGSSSGTFMTSLRYQVWNITFLIGFVVYLSIRGVFARRTKTNQKTISRIDTLEKILLAIVIPAGVLLPVLYIFTPLLSFADYNLPPFVPWCGTLLMVAALWLFWRSHADLGLNWSVSLEIREGHQLIRHGVYRSLRHPMYASLFLWGIAQGLLLQNWLAGWSSLVPFALMYVLRTSREEEMMLEFFGPQYRDYMRETGRLLPRLRRTARGE